MDCPRGAMSVISHHITQTRLVKVLIFILVLSIIQVVPNVPGVIHFFNCNQLIERQGFIRGLTGKMTLLRPFTRPFPQSVHHESLQGLHQRCPTRGRA